MSEDWAAIAAEVAGAIGDVGYTATLLRRGAPTGPEWEPVPGPDTRHTVKLLGDTIALGLIGGTAINAGDRRELMAAETIAPTPADRMQIGSTVYAIIRAEPYAPGGAALFYDLILRA